MLRIFRLSGIAQPWLTMTAGPGHLIPIGLMMVFMAVVLRLPTYLPLQMASWLTFIALLITPGYFLTEIITGRLDMDWLERLALAFPLGIVALALVGLPVLLLHLTIRELALGWTLIVTMLLIAWLIQGRWMRKSPHCQNLPWTWDEIGMVLLLVAAFIYLWPTLLAYKINGDAYTFLAYVCGALTGQPMNVTEPLFGTTLGPGVRVAFNQFLPLWSLWSYLPKLDPVELTGQASRSMLAVWAILASYTLGKAAGAGSRRFGLFIASIQLLIYMAAPFFRDDSVSNFFFENIHADKFTVTVTILPVVFALSIRYLREGRFAVWVAATLAAFAVSTIHPLIAAMLVLAISAFGGLHLWLNLRHRTAWVRVAFLVVLVGITMVLPFVQLFMAHHDAPLASTFPRSFEGWSIGEKMSPTLPFFQIESLDVYGPLPDLAHLDASLANTEASPFLIWRFAVNMDRQRLILFNLHHYMFDPGLVLEPPYLISLLITPFLLWQLRSCLAAQFALSTTLALIFVMFNPIVTPLLGSLVTPWILWRMVWLLPYTLTIALVMQRLLTVGVGAVAPLLKPGLAQNALRPAAPLGLIIGAGLLLGPGIVANVHELHYRASGPRSYPRPQQILARLDQLTAYTGPVMVAADQDLSVTVPAYVANANVIAHRVFNTSEIFPADQQDRALQRLIDQHHLFHTPLLSPTSIEILQRYNVRYVIAASGSDLDIQLRLVPGWFEWQMDDQSYTLYTVRRAPIVTASIRGNEAFLQHQWETARQYYQAALEQDSTDLLALAGLAETYWVQGQFDLASDILEQATAQMDLPVLHYRLGQLYAELGQIERSMPEFDRAQQAAPLVAPFHLALGQACLRASQYQCAGEQYKAAVAVEALPNEALRLMALADLWQQQGQPHLALNLYEQAVTLRPDKQSQLLLAAVYQDLEQFDQAEALLRALRAENLLSAEIVFRIARLLAAQAATDQAIELYRYAIWLQALKAKDASDIRLALIQTLLDAGNLAEAHQEIEQMLAQQPNSASAYVLLGNLYHKQNQPVTAVIAYQHALQLDPSEVVAHLSLSDQYRRYAVLDENLELLQMTSHSLNLPLDPEQAALLLSMGNQFQRLGDMQSAILAYNLTLGSLKSDGLLTRAGQQSVAHRRALAYARLATVHEDLGEVQIAMNYYRAAVGAASTEPWSQVLLGDALRRRNDVSAAEATYRQAIQTGPSYLEAYLHLAELLRSQGNTTAVAELYQQALQNFSVQSEQPGAQSSLVSFNRQFHWPEPDLGSGADSESLEADSLNPFLQNKMDVYIQSLDASDNLAAVPALARLYQEIDQAEAAVQLYQQRIQAGEKEALSPLILARYYKGLGDLYLNQRQFDPAIRAYQQVSTLDGWWPEARLGLAQALFEQGDRKEALAQFQSVVEIAPGSIEAQVALADALDQQGDKARALTIYQATARAFPGNVHANLALAQAWQARNHWDEAEQGYRQAIGITPNNARAYVGLASLYINRGRFAEAESLLQQAIQLDHSYTETYLDLGELLARLARYSEAVTIYEQALQVAAGDGRIYAGLARVHQALGQIDQAIDCLNKAAIVDPARPQPMIQLASLYREQNQPGQAEEMLLQALDRSPDHATIRYALADLYHSQALSDEAMIQLRLAAQEKPNSMEALARYADELRQQDRQEEAEALYQQAEQADERSEMGYRALATARQAQGRLEEALALIEQAIAFAPNEPMNWIQKGQLQAQLGDQEDALSSLQQATQVAPSQGQTWYALGDSLLSSGQTEQAVSALKQAVTVEPAYLPTYGSLIQAYQNLKQHDEAAQVVALAQKIGPASYLTDIYAARFWQNQQLWDQARAALDQALAKAPGMSDPLMAMGELERRLGNVAQAVAWYEQAVTLHPGDQTATIYLLDLLLKQGDNGQALTQVQQALQSWPGNSDLVLQLGRVQRALGLFTEAESTFMKAARLNRADSGPYAELAALHLAQGKTEAAIAAYQQAIALKPAQESTYLALSQAWSSQGQPDQALAVLNDGLSQVFHPAPLYAAKATLYLQRDEPQLALATLQQAIQQIGEESRLLQALGTYHQARAEFERAEQVYNHLLALYPDEATSHIAIADFSLHRGRAAAAVAYYEQALVLEPANAEVYLALGQAYQLTGHTLEATSAYSQALVLEPTRGEAYLKLASLYQLQARWPDTQAIYERGLAAVPTSGLLMNEYSTFLHQRGHTDQALAVLDRAANLSPGVETFSARANLYRILGRPAEAEQDLLAAIEMVPGSVEAWQALADLRQAQGDLSNAALAYQKVIALAPGLAPGYLGLAGLTYNRGNLDEARRQFELALKAEPASAESLVRLAEARAGQGNWEGAEAAYRQAVLAAPLTSEAYLGLAEVVQRRSGSLQDALAWLEQAAQLGLNQGLIYRASGDAYRRAGQSGLAAGYFQQAIGLEPGLPDGYLALADFYLAQGLPQQAEPYARQALEIAPGSPMAYIALGNVYYSLGDSSAAAENYRLAINSDATRTEGYVALAQLFLDQQNYSEASAAYQQAIHLAPMSWALWLSLGEIYAKLGQSDEALSLFEQAAVLNPTAPDPWLHRGDLYLSQGNAPAAKMAFEQAAGLRPTEAGPLLRLAELFEKQGNLDQAEDYARQAIATAPFEAASYTRLGDIFAKREGSARIAEAMDNYLKAVQLDPRQFSAYWSWSRLRVDKEQGRTLTLDTSSLEAALAEFAAGPDSQKLWVWVMLAVGYSRVEGATDQVLTHLKEASALDPVYIDLYQQLALTYEEQSNNQLALEAWHHYLAATRARHADTSLAETHIAALLNE